MPSRTDVGPQIIVCTRHRGRIANRELRLRHLGHAFCEECARVLGLVPSTVERDPAKFGGHTYVGPKETR